MIVSFVVIWTILLFTAAYVKVWSAAMTFCTLFTIMQVAVTFYFILMSQKLRIMIRKVVAAHIGKMKRSVSAIALELLLLLLALSIVIK